jgi:hypothetical protein
MPFALTRRKLLLVSVIVVTGALLGSWFALNPHDSSIEGIQVWGSKEFIAQVEKALTLLRDKSPDDLALVQHYVGRIQEHERSGMRAYDNPPTFDLNMKTAGYSVSWCAGSIVHDAFHSKLYNDYRAAHGEPVPDSEWTGQAAEMKCIVVQLSTLNSIGAPEYEIEYASTLDGSHFDLDGDGQSTDNDYWKADW